MKEKKKLIPILLILLLGISIGIYLFTQGQTVQGKVEQRVVPHYSQVSGFIKELNVQQGQTVKAGDTLAVIDNTDLTYTLQQLEQSLIQQEANLAQAQNGAEPAAIKQAQQAVISAQANYETMLLAYNTASDKLQDMQALYELGAISMQEYDASALETQRAQLALQSAQAQVESAKQQVILVSGGANTWNVQKAQAVVEQTKLQIAQTKETLDKYTIKADCSGTVISVNYTQGAILSAGSDLCEITDEAQTYVLAYVTEKQLANLTCRDVLQIKTDGEPITGIISHIDVEAVYTPKEFQTAIQQNQKTFQIKLDLAEDTELKPGQTVTVDLRKTE